MTKSTILYAGIVAVFTAAFVIVMLWPADKTTGYLCLAGIILFIWRIYRGDD